MMVKFICENKRIHLFFNECYYMLILYMYYSKFSLFINSNVCCIILMNSVTRICWEIFRVILYISIIMSIFVVSSQEINN